MPDPDATKRPHHAAPASYARLKNAVEPFLALTAIVLLLPLLLWIAWRVRRDSPGPAIFTQIRAGKNGSPFTFFKFRTMRQDVDPFGDSPEGGDDPRLTPFGKRIRESSLDELPQLFNVLRGEMSFVGPRPLFMQQAAQWNDRQRRRLDVKPGITGFAQVRGRATITIEEKLELDVKYVEQMNLRTDVDVIWRTVHDVRDQSGLYQVQYSRERKRYAE